MATMCTRCSDFRSKEAALIAVATELLDREKRLEEREKRSIRKIHTEMEKVKQELSAEWEQVNAKITAEWEKMHRDLINHHKDRMAEEVGKIAALEKIIRTLEESIATSGRVAAQRFDEILLQAKLIENLQKDIVHLNSITIRLQNERSAIDTQISELMKTIANNTEREEKLNKRIRKLEADLIKAKREKEQLIKAVNKSNKEQLKYREDAMTRDIIDKRQFDELIAVNKQLELMHKQDREDAMTHEIRAKREFDEMKAKIERMRDEGAKARYDYASVQEALVSERLVHNVELEHARRQLDDMRSAQRNERERFGRNYGNANKQDSCKVN